MKREERCKAKDIYISPLFKKALAYTLAHYDKVFILSAKYGLLDLDDIIEPYDLTLNTMNKKQRKQWAYKVYYQIQERIGFSHEWYFYAGGKYREYLQQVLKPSYAPLKHLGIGKQLAFYKKNITK